jgi:2'-5' RNA ligase
MPQSLRSFIAVEISPNVRARAAKLIQELRVTDANVSWVQPQSLHLTLVFLGDIQMLDVPALCEAMNHAVADLPPFDLEVRGAGAFPDAARPRTIWLGVGQGTEEMVTLHAALEDALIDVGYRPEGRRYRPHLTLGRVRQAPRDSAPLLRLLEDRREFLTDVMSVADITLFSSQLTRDGPVYDPLGTAELRGK